VRARYINLAPTPLVAKRESPMIFRLATAADVPIVVALVESAYRGNASRAGWTTEADLLDGQRTDQREVSQLIEDPAARLVLACDNDEIIACVLVRREADGAAHIAMFAVSPKRQGQGIGAALLACAEHVAREEHGATRSTMAVIEQRPELIRWYTRRGYRLTGRTEPFPYGDERFGLPRRDDLRFLVLEKGL
jgi:ribosomal protein S18 acetylase RimI-like enzyme